MLSIRRPFSFLLLWQTLPAWAAIMGVRSLSQADLCMYLFLKRVVGTWGKFCPWLPISCRQGTLDRRSHGWLGTANPASNH